MSITSAVKVRFATREDVGAILILIRELAEYEKALNEVSNSVEQLIKDGFETNPAFECMVAEMVGDVVGFALFYTSYSTWKGKCLYLEDLCVRASLRRNGIGAKLFESVLQLARDRNMKRLSWQVLDWNTPAIEFYKKYSAELDPTWVNGRIVTG